MTEAPSPAVSDGSALTAREAELLRRAGERVFTLSRQLATAEARNRQLQAELEHTREMLTETRQSRGILSAQVASLQREVEREFEERSELRKLLASLQMQLQALLPSVVAPAMPSPPMMQIARSAPQRGSSQTTSQGGQNRSSRWLGRAAREIGILGRR